MAERLTASRIKEFFGRPGPAGMLLAGVFILALIVYWHGLGPADEHQYVRAAERWFEEGPFLGENHWYLRHLYVMPMAASFAAFGDSEFSAALPSILYAAALVAITFYFGRRFLGHYEALAAAALMAASAYFVARPIEIDVYGAEIFFLALAVWLFLTAHLGRRKFAYLFAAGVTVGLAWTVREIAIATAIGFAVLTLLFDRRAFFQSGLALALGFGGVVLAELILYWIAAGDPFYRYKVDLNHGHTPVLIKKGWLNPTLNERLYGPIMDILTAPASTPFLFAAAGAGFLLRKDFVAAPALQRRTLISFAIISAITFPLTSWGMRLSLPHYYPILFYTAYLALGLACVFAAKRWGLAVGAAAFTGVVALNLVAQDFRNYDDYADSRFLAKRLPQIEELVYTDHLTALRARMLLRFEGQSPREAYAEVLGVTTPPPGSLFFKAYPTPTTPEPDKSWCLIAEEDVRRRPWTHRLLQAFGVGEFGPRAVQRVIAPPRPVKLLRVPDETGACVTDEAVAADDSR